MTEWKDKEYMPWLEESLKAMLEFEPTAIALVALNEEGETLCGYSKCGAADVFAMAGALQAEGVWKQIEANGQKLREIMEADDDSTE